MAEVEKEIGKWGSCRQLGRRVLLPRLLPLFSQRRHRAQFDRLPPPVVQHPAALRDPEVGSIIPIPVTGRRRVDRWMPGVDRPRYGVPDS